MGPKHTPWNSAGLPNRCFVFGVLGERRGDPQIDRVSAGSRNPAPVGVASRRTSSNSAHRLPVAVGDLPVETYDGPRVGIPARGLDEGRAFAVRAVVTGCGLGRLPSSVPGCHGLVFGHGAVWESLGSVGRQRGG